MLSGIQHFKFHRCEDGIKSYGHREAFSVYPMEYKISRMGVGSLCAGNAAGEIFERRLR